MAEEVMPNGQQESSRCSSACKEFCKTHKILICIIIIEALLVGPYILIKLDAGRMRPGYHLSLGAGDKEYYLTWSDDWPNWLMIRRCRKDHLTRSRPENFDYKLVSIRRAKGNNPDASDVHVFKVKLSMGSGSTCRFDPKPHVSRNSNLTMAFYSNLDTKTGGATLAHVQSEVDKDTYDVVFHNGNFGFDKVNSTLNGDRFMSMIEPIASRVSYQTSAGSSESYDNFEEYNTLFSMIDGGPVNTGAINNHYYSFNSGPVHFVVISTELYYNSGNAATLELKEQYMWLKEDLRRVHDRTDRPWVIVIGHRPMYCTSKASSSDCSHDNNLLRKGLSQGGWNNNTYALEKLFYDFSVDVQIYSHEDHYERFLPIYDGNVYNMGSDNPYRNARAPVHILTGSAGGEVPLKPWTGTAARGSQKRVYEYGYCKLMASIAKLHFQRVSNTGSLMDEFVISKDQARNYPFNEPQL